jgi:hypothetical protein
MRPFSSVASRVHAILKKSTAADVAEGRRKLRFVRLPLAMSSDARLVVVGGTHWDVAEQQLGDSSDE